MRRDILNITTELCLSSLSDFRSTLSHALETCLIEQNVIHNATVCFSEIATNSIEHNNADKINFRAWLENDILSLEIRDNGDCIDAEEINSSADNSNIGLFSLDEESGRGLAIIKQLSQFFSANNEQGNWHNVFTLGWEICPQIQRDSILIVEDDLALQALYKHYLISDFTVLCANNGVDALEILKNHTPALILSDINMPEMNGIELRRNLNNTPKYAAIPFIFLTMDESGKRTEEAIRLGIDDFLTKPVDKTTLLDTVKRILTRIRSLSEQLNTRIDAQISAALCPSLPEHIDNWDICLCARNTGHGGGDVIIHHQTHDATYIALLDVMGHDDTAKFFSYAYSGYIRGLMHALDKLLSPAEILQQLSNEIYNDSLLSQLTLTCCIVELRDGGRCRIASAGHPQPFRLTQDEVQTLNSSGMLLGLLPDQPYINTEYRFTSKQKLALYTDGLFESAHDNTSRAALEYEIHQSLENSGDSHAKNLLEQVFSIFDTHTKHNPSDDALLILIEPR